jgi:hypothetical protein
MEGKENTSEPGLEIEFDIASIDDVVEASETKEEPTVEEPKATEEDKKEEVVETASEKKEELEDIETPESSDEKVEETSEEESDDSVVSEIISKLGYEVEGDFEDSTEGIIELTKSVSEKMAEETLENIFNQHPSIKQHLDFVMAGGDPNAFTAIQREQLFSDVEIDEKNTDLQKQVLKKYFEARGDESSFINDMIETYEDKGQLFEKANQAKSALVKAQEAKKARLLESQKAEAEARAKQAEETWNIVRDTVSNAEELSGIPISQRDRNKFIDFISKPIDNRGATARDVAASKLTLEEQLAMDFFLFKGKDFKKLMNVKARTAASKSLRERLKAETGKVKGGKSDPRIKGGTTSAADDIALDDLF